MKNLILHNSVIITYAISLIALLILCYIIIKEIRMYRRSKEIYNCFTQIDLEQFQQLTLEMILQELEERDTLIYLDPDKYTEENPDEPREEDYLW